VGKHIISGDIFIFQNNKQRSYWNLSRRTISALMTLRYEFIVHTSWLSVAYMQDGQRPIKERKVKE
jgi:hypothetical protein